jgi:hypothetical protein
MGNKKRVKRGDLVLLLIGIIIALSLTGFYLKNGGAAQGKTSDRRIAVITRNGNKIAELDLNKIKEPRYFRLDDGINVTILAENGTIKFLDADCPDKICVKTGILTKPGDQAICMPSKTIVRILDN